MGFSEAVRSAFSKYATFSGRARPAEYWWFVVFNILGNIVTGAIDYSIFGGYVAQTADGYTIVVQNSPLSGLFSLAIFLPGLSVMVRRLHDVGRSGWWFWIVLIPVVGFFILIYWMIRRGDVGDNDYGPDPLGYGSSVPRA